MTCTCAEIHARHVTPDGRPCACSVKCPACCLTSWEARTCAECGNDDAAEGHHYCTDCLEELYP